MTISQKSIYLFLLLLFCQCKSDLRQAEDSLNGTWVVNKIISSYGEISAGGTSYNEQFTEEGQLGTFIFTDDQADYNFTRRDTLTSEVSDWVLNRAKVQEGFTRVERYTLDLEKLDFQCAFGDGTSDAEQEATEILLSFETTALGPFTQYQLYLEKQE